MKPNKSITYLDLKDSGIYHTCSWEPAPVFIIMSDAATEYVRVFTVTSIRYVLLPKRSCPLLVQFTSSFALPFYHMHLYGLRPKCKEYNIKYDLNIWYENMIDALSCLKASLISGSVTDDLILIFGDLFAVVYFQIDNKILLKPKIYW